MQAIDFTTYFVRSVSQDAIQQLLDQGIDHAIIGFDSSPSSIQVVRAFLDMGFTWDAYRVVYSNRDPEPDIDDCVQGIHSLYRTRRDLPGFVWLDVEQRPAFPSIDQVTRAMDRLEQKWDIKPYGSHSSMVAGGIYTGKWVWDGAYGNWNEPAKRRYALWLNAQTELFGGWGDDDLIGWQTAYDVPKAFGDVDLSTLRERSLILI